MSRVLIFRHVPFEGAGHIVAELERRSIAWHYADLWDAPAGLPDDPANHDALIFLGGPMSANDRLPFLRQEERMIRDAMARRQPVLGICLGSQLIARALGAEVRRNPASEIGWFPLRLSEAASIDPLLSALHANETVFHWHSDTWDLPPGATLLASSERCAHQAFRVGDRVYGFQFHPEVTPAMIADWCTQDANCGDLRELAAPLDPHRNSERLSVLAAELFARWCDLVCTARSDAAGG